jgi:hypothetical protein
MASDDPGSIISWLGDLQEGDYAVAQPLWGRYFERLVRLARQKFRRARHAGTADGEEDAASSDFDSFFRAAARGHFPQLAGRHDFWRLLVALTAHKVTDQVRYTSRLKRSGDWVRGEADLAAGPGGVPSGLDRLVGSEPAPEFAASVADECCYLLGALGDETPRRVPLLRMEGYSDPGIAARLGCGVRTVGRKLELIGKIWMRGVAP